MASVDSGVDTGNESNDSNFTTDSANKVMDEASGTQLPPPRKRQQFYSTEFYCTIDNSLRNNKSFFETPLGLSCQNVYSLTSAQSSFVHCGYPAEEHHNKISLRHMCKKRYQILRFQSKNHEIAHIKEILAEKRLRMAASLNHVETVKRLLDAGVNPQASDEKKRTALHIAACKGYKDIVGLLLDNGADPNQKDVVGNTPLQVAAYTNNFTVILMLLRATVANLHSLDESGCKLLRLLQTRMKRMTEDLNFLVSEDESLRDILVESIDIFDVIFKHCSEKVENDLISGFSNQLRLKHAKEENENTIQDVLSSLSELTLQKKM